MGSGMLHMVGLDSVYVRLFYYYIFGPCHGDLFYLSPYVSAKTVFATNGTCFLGNICNTTSLPRYIRVNFICNTKT
jgi:hypothetical protein